MKNTILFMKFLIALFFHSSCGMESESNIHSTAELTNKSISPDFDGEFSKFTPCAEYVENENNSREEIIEVEVPSACSQYYSNQPILH